MTSLEPAPPTYPLTRDQFARALTYGLGRARLHIDRHGATGIEDLIVDACVHDRTFDPLCEHERAPWMFELAVAAGIEGDVALGIAGVQGESGGDRLWAQLPHRCKIAARLAARGHTIAREALYNIFRRTVAADDPVGALQILQLDGSAGLTAVAEIFGQRLAQNSAFDVSGYADLSVLDDEFGPGWARTVLERAAGDNPDIGRFLDRIARPEAEAPAPRRPFSLAEVLAGIDDPQSRLAHYHFGFWGKHASEEDLLVVAEHLRELREPRALRQCLTCFARRPYSALLPDFLALGEHAERRVRWVAIQALAQITHPDVRALALRRMAARRLTEQELTLLQRNYVAGDDERIAQVLHLPADRDDLHWLAMDVLRVFETNPSPGARGCVLWAYEHTPCGNCRHDAVKWLLKENLAPAWLLEEARFDADEQTRELCAGKSGAA